uniref:Uncharacterized protein n=1 Tax=Anguilla anguilla TaxID=7936 RepID=A0A0E9URX6_ANGAN
MLFENSLFEVFLEPQCNEDLIQVLLQILLSISVPFLFLNLSELYKEELTEEKL